MAVDISEAALIKREEWERCAPNAYELPDDFVLALIAEIRQLRIKVKENQ
jgi:hypothetical protein